jgi:hypothetical protein
MSLVGLKGVAQSTIISSEFTIVSLPLALSIIPSSEFCIVNVELALSIILSSGL